MLRVDRCFFENFFRENIALHIFKHLLPLLVSAFYNMLIPVHRVTLSRSQGVRPVMAVSVEAPRHSCVGMGIIKSCLLFVDILFYSATLKKGPLLFGLFERKSYLCPEKFA